MQWETGIFSWFFFFFSFFLSPYLKTYQEVPNRQINWLERRANIYKYSLRESVCFLEFTRLQGKWITLRIWRI